MKNAVLLLIAFILLTCAKNNRKNKEISETILDKKVEKLASNFKFTEGPTVDVKGNVYFSDIPGNKIFIWTIENKLDTFSLKSGRANGLYFDKDENLLVCESGKGQITSTSPNGEYISIATEYNGKKFNQPNDIWSDGKSGAYFTDPKYGPESNNLSQDGMHVYYINPEHTKVTRVCDDLEKPNGILGTPDGKTLYVADPQAKKIYKYDIQKDGSLKNKTIYVELGCDGMTIDKTGNMYLTTEGKQAIEIFSPSGKLLESIAIPEQPSNVCFGGKDRNELYITARTSIYRVKLDTQGVD